MDNVDLRFQRAADGSVYISVVADNDRKVTDLLLSPEMWAAAVAGVSAQGAAPERVALVRNFHMHGAKSQPEEAEGWDGNGSPIAEFPAPTST